MEPLSIVFNQSMSERIFPDVMKLADTVPLYKNKEKYLVDNLLTNLLTDHSKQNLRKINAQKSLQTSRRE